MKKILLVLLMLLCASILFAQKIEKVSDQIYKITGDNYTAQTSDYNGGYLSSFVVNGEEFIDSVVEGTRGSYFHNGGVVKITNVTLDGNKLICSSPVGKVTYNFMPKKVEITAEDLVDAGMSYFTIWDVNVVMAKEGDKYIKAPLTSSDTEFIWFKNKAAIKTTGDAKFWGPWSNNRQVVDLALAGKQTKKLVIEPTVVSEQDINETIKAAYPIMTTRDEDVVIYSPKEYEVFQRVSKVKGYVLFSGRINKKVDSIYYKIQGKDLNGKSLDNKWNKLNILSNGSFDQKVPCNAGGWYKIQIKTVKNNKEKIYDINKVGIGEIILGAGQSNSTNCGQFPSKQTSGMVSSTDGINWKYADDPQIGVHDGSGGGSLYPALGDALYKEFKVPIGIAATGHGGTSTNQWQPGGELYNWFMTRVDQFGVNGFRCVIWHQGESDVWMTTNDYYYRLANVILNSQKDAGWYFPWFVAKVSYLNASNAKFDSTRNAHQKLWDDKIAMEGPDTDILMGDYRDYDGQGIHFSLKGLKKHGEMWAEYISKYIHSQID